MGSETVRCASLVRELAAPIGRLGRTRNASVGAVGPPRVRTAHTTGSAKCLPLGTHSGLTAPCPVVAGAIAAGTAAPHAKAIVSSDYRWRTKDAAPGVRSALLDDAYSGSADGDAVVTACVLAATRASVGARATGRPSRSRYPACAVLANSGNTSLGSVSLALLLGGYWEATSIAAGPAARVR
jgi:hypothetical protein